MLQDHDILWKELRQEVLTGEQDDIDCPTCSLRDDYGR